MTVEKPTKGVFNVSIIMANGTATIRASNITELYFIEDIFSYAITGKLRFNDDVGLVEKGPLTGNESINIEYGYGDNIRGMMFKIFKIQNIKQATSAGTAVLNSVEIIFVHRLFEIMNYLKYSKSWYRKKIHDIVYGISRDMIGVVNWGLMEETNEALEYFYMPYWTPNTAFNWLFKRATGVKSSQSGFLYYESTKKDLKTIPAINFITLDSLLSSAPLLTVEDDTGKTDGGIYIHESEGGSYISKILNWHISGTDKWSMRTLAGATLCGFDDKRKTFLQKKLKFDDEVQKQTILGTKSLFSDVSDERVSLINTNETNITEVAKAWESKWQKQYALQQTMNFEVTGHPDRYCGTIIQVDWGSKDPDETRNKNYSGIYLVKSITHYFNPKAFPIYRQKLNCIKNGYWQSDKSNLLDTGKSRL